MVGFGVRFVFARCACTSSGLRSYPTIGVLRDEGFRGVISPAISFTSIFRCVYGFVIPFGSYLLRRFGVYVMFSLVERGFFLYRGSARRVFVRFYLGTLNLYRALFVCSSLYNVFLHRFPISPFLASAKRRNVREDGVFGVSFRAILRAFGRVQLFRRSQQYTSVLFTNQTMVVIVLFVFVTIHLTNRATTATTTSRGAKGRMGLVQFKEDPYIGPTRPLRRVGVILLCSHFVNSLRAGPFQEEFILALFWFRVKHYLFTLSRYSNMDFVLRGTSSYDYEPFTVLSIYVTAFYVERSIVTLVHRE